MITKTKRPPSAVSFADDLNDKKKTTVRQLPFHVRRIKMVAKTTTSLAAAVVSFAEYLSGNKYDKSDSCCFLCGLSLC